MSVPDPTHEELLDLSSACDKLWALDDQRLDFGSDLVINLSGMKRSIHDIVDRCEGNFFTHVDQSVWRKETYSRLRDLLNNYTPVCGQAEAATAEERKEEVAFVDAVYSTRPMQYCHKYLAAHKKIGRDPNEFKRMIWALWFGMYRRTRGGPLDSSGFEHVFVGEIKDGEVSGCHNWVKIYLEELAGNLNYKGFLMGRGRGGRSPPQNPYAASLQFDWLGVTKRVGSSLIGVSPEFEMALYTMCFMTGNEKNVVELGDYLVTVVCYDYNGGKNIGTCFCEI